MPMFQETNRFKCDCSYCTNDWCPPHRHISVEFIQIDLLPTGSKERGVLGVGSIPVAIHSSCQDMKTFAL